ncbi:RAxF-45 family protein [Ornithinibacillus gellani]
MCLTGKSIMKFKEYLWMRYAIFSDVSLKGDIMSFFNVNIWKNNQ